MLFGFPQVEIQHSRQRSGDLQLCERPHHDWAADFGEGIYVVKLPIAEIWVEHEVKLKDFKSWLERSGGCPCEIIERQKIRGILGMPSMR